jgi:GT2 family glycosyltransferase
MSSACVVVPTLDRPDLLTRCIESVLKGERQPDQLVVCDQSIDTETRQAVEKINQEGATVQYLHMERPHTSMARNAGLYASRTSLVAFIDDDCVAHPRWLNALVSRYESASAKESIASVCGRVLPLREGNTARKHAVSSRNSPNLRYLRRGKGSKTFAGWAPWDAGTGGNLLAPRASLLAVGGFDTRLGPGSPARSAEDIDLLYRLSEQGTLIYEPAAAVYHPMQSRGGRLRRRFSYGQGMGSMLGLHLWERDKSARGLLLLYVRHQIANAARRGAWGLPESTLQLAGAGYALVRIWLETKVGQK